MQKITVSDEEWTTIHDGSRDAAIRATGIVSLTKSEAASPPSELTVEAAEGEWFPIFRGKPVKAKASSGTVVVSISS
jgi:hypothetical protein